MLQRVLRVIKLDQTVFTEIEKDESATAEAAIIVVVTGFLSAIGAGIASDNFLLSFLGTLISAVVGWVVWSLITLWVGTKIFNGQADLGEMLRCIGYANAPNLLGFFAFIPCVGWIVALVGSILALVAAFFGIREALDLDTGKTLATVVIGWIVALVVSIIIGIIIGVPAAIIGGIAGS